MNDATSALVRAFRSLTTVLTTIFCSLFGDVQWKPPLWLSRLTSTITSAGKSTKQSFGAHPKHWLLGACTVTIAALTYIHLCELERNRPKPRLISMNVATPKPMQLKKDAKPENLVVTFYDSVAKIEAVGKPVVTGVSLSPAHAGAWKWETDRVLVFEPSAEWLAGTTYTVHFDRSLTPSHVQLSGYDLPFTTQPFTARLTKTSFVSNPGNAKDKKVIAELQFSHPVDKSDLEKRLGMLSGEKRLMEKELAAGNELSSPEIRRPAFTVEYDEFAGKAFIHSAPIAIPNDPELLVFTAAKGIRAAAGGPPADMALSSRTVIPGMFEYFRVESVDAKIVRTAEGEPEHVMFVEMNEPLTRDEVQKNVEVFLLPKNKPAVGDQEAIEDYSWSPTEVAPEVLALGSPVDVKWNHTENETSTIQSATFTAPEGRQLFTRIKRGLRSSTDYILAAPREDVLQVSRFPREVRLMHRGALLSLGGDKKLALQTRDVRAVQIELSRVVPTALSYLVSQTSGNYDKPTFNWGISADDIAERFTEVKPIPATEPGKVQYSNIDLAPHLAKTGAGPRGIFILTVKAWNPDKNEEDVDASLSYDGETEESDGSEEDDGSAKSIFQDRRLVALTDLGLVVKHSQNGEKDVFVESFRSGEPVGGARVIVLGRNGLPVLTQQTDDLGRAHFPPIADFKRESEPVAFVVDHQSDVSFLPIGRSDRNLNMSRFEVGGLYTDASLNRLQAYLFTDRGIYRPGDTLHIGLVLKQDDWKPVTGMPLELVFTDPRGIEISSRKFQVSNSGFHEFDLTPSESAPTGVYQAELYLPGETPNSRGSVLGSTKARVEEFLPDRMKMKTSFSQDSSLAWLTPAELSGQVEIQTLFGPPAANRRVKGELRAVATSASFTEFPDYQFTPTSDGELSIREDLEDRTTDADGKAVFPLDLGRFSQTVFRVTFGAEGFEADGGRSVSAESTALVSPLAFLLGVKPDGDLGYVKKDSSRGLQYIAINQSRKKVAAPKLTAELVENRYVSVLTKQYNGSYAYQSLLKKVSLSKSPLDVTEEGTRFPLVTAQAGDFVIVVTDEKGQELQRTAYHVAGVGNVTRTLEINSELQLKLAKTDYAAGEEIEVEIRAPFTGSGLITIEKNKVYTHHWFKATSTNSVERIRVPEELEGNAYLGVTFVRSLDSPEIFMNPLSFGVVPFSVSKEKRTNSIALTSPEKTRPGEPMAINFQTKFPGKIAVFAVDEGILQVARYRTPDPLSYLYRKRALEVETTQILDLLLPELSVLQSLSAPGGDGDADLGKFLNPFKRKRQLPAVYWSGILDASGAPQQVTYTPPAHFNGSLRVMAVAVADNAVGVAESKTIVRAPFVLTPQVPAFAAPGDHFVATATVTNTLEGSGKAVPVKVTALTGSELTIDGETTREIQLDENAEAVVEFRVTAGQKLGAATLRLEVSSAEIRVKDEAELSIRPASHRYTKIQLSSGEAKEATLPITRELYAELRDVEASGSTMPLSLGRGLSTFLKVYPYQCTEQLLSRAFPLLLAGSVPDLTPRGLAPAAELERLSAVLRSRQNGDGAIGVWAANANTVPFHTIYAAHFLTEARSAGVAVDDAVLKGTLKVAREMAKKRVDSLEQARLSAYSIYVLTRNGEVTQELVRGLREQLEKFYDPQWRTDLTAAYLAGAYSLMQDQAEGEKLIAGVRYGTIERKYGFLYYYDTLIASAELFSVASLHFPAKAKEYEGAFLKELDRSLRGQDYTTTSSAYSLLALLHYAKAREADPTNLRIEEVLADETVRAATTTGTLLLNAELSTDARKVKFLQDRVAPLFAQLTESGFDRQVPLKATASGIEVSREIRNEAGDAVGGARIGDKLIVSIRVRSIDGRSHSDVAVVDLLPSGVEIDLTDESPQSLGQKGKTPAWTPDHVDRREDRVLAFGTATGEVREYTYAIRVTNRGEFVLPPIFAEAMYEPSVQSQSAGGTFVVQGK